MDPNLESIKSVIEVFSDSACKALGRIYYEIRKRIALRGDRPDVIRQLFLGSGHFLFHPSSDYNPVEGQTKAPPAPDGYPHDIQGLLSFEPFLPSKTTLEESLVFRRKLLPTTRLVCSGSPKANQFSRQYLPSFAVTEDGPVLQYPKLAFAPQRASYLFGEDLVAPKIQVVSMMRKGEVLGKTRKVIWRWHRGSLIPWSPPGYERGGRLEKDFLLVSRFPRHKAGSDVLIFAGGHGAGTQALAILLHKLPILQLRDLADFIGLEPYFQFVLEVSDIQHEASGTVAKKVELSKDLPPVILKELTARDLGQFAGGAKE